MKIWKNYYFTIGVSNTWFNRCKICDCETKNRYIIIKKCKNSLKPKRLYHVSCFVEKHPILGKELKEQFAPELMAEAL